VGSGWDRYRAEITQNQDHCHLDNIYPRASELLKIALQLADQGNGGINALNVLPTYLRDNVTQ